MSSPADPFPAERGIPPRSAGRARWPRVARLRAATDAGRDRWQLELGPFRTERAARRAARKQRDASGVRYQWTPGARLFAVALLRKGEWWVLTRPARGKRDASEN